ncbi:autotransporter outer membrane beta-barrel domain-containing protein [Xenorhabdus sp. BG5]|uniref:autotransporter outer membrane beta-barrel domain-containing protein n=1 Tax=Xenorhabdus sp. BG5 TaxID=2782014 RepID=UPI00187EA5CB|nr:autotransporter outer membrane beta-barrel domain-containing protein [Xenorhabdus sp. BG5]MBE8595165.1 autotransporter outer membrane beta-barrel domain-containing protein [Xenorhabdus sp. BG5]
MKIYRYAVLPMALRVALFFPGVSVNAIAAASSCGSSNTTTISDAETEPYNLSSGDNLIINKGASIDAPRGQPTTSDPYGLKYSAVNVGENNNIAPKTLVDCIENNGVLQGTNGVIVTYSGSVGTLLNHGIISGVMGAIWASGHINTLDNYGSIKLIDASNSYNSIQIQQASNTDKNDQLGSIDTIINREKGSIDGIAVTTSILKNFNNYGILSLGNIVNSAPATFVIESGSNVGTFNNDGTVTGPNHGVLIRGGGYLENLNNNSGSKGITADQDAIQVTEQGMTELNVNPQIRPSKIKQITNASLLYGKKNGIHIDDKGVIDTITNLDGGVIKGDQFAIKNNGTMTNDIHNSGAIDGNVELGSASLYMSGPNVTLKGNVSGAKNSVVTIGAKGATTGNLDLTYTHDMNIGTVNILSGSTLRLGDGHNTGSITSNVDNAGSLYFNRNNKVTYNHIISGAGSVHQVGSGTTILTEANTYTGETKIESGILQLGNKGLAGSLDNTSKVTIGQSGVLAFDRTNPTLFAADIEGAGFLHQQGTGDLTLTGNVTTGKPITVTSGKLRFGDGNTIGKLSLTGIDNKGAVVVAGTKSSMVTLDGEISGTGTLEIAGGKAIITSDSNYSGQTSIGNGATLQLGHGGTTGNLTKSDILNKGTLALNLSGTSNFDGVISGSGHIDKIGAGVTRLSSDSLAFTGSTRVKEGTLVVDGQLGTKTSTFNVKNGGEVNGTGIIGGTATIESGGHLTGKQGDTLTFSKDLILNSGANVDISFGAKDVSAPALFDVHGDLTLAGTLNVTDLGGLAAGEYDIFHYGGTLTDNGMTFTGGKPDSFSLGTNRNHEVHLINTGGMILNYWDGGDISKHNNNAIGGGDGIWQVGGNDNWTSKTGYPNASWKSTDQFAIFSGIAGTVQVDNSGGNVTVNGMQFSADGYKITGGSLVLENDKTGSAKIRVGTGNKSTAGRIATIESILTGAATLETTDDGTLVLNGENKYTGGTKVTRGILQVGDGGTKGSISGDVVTGSKGTLAFDRANAVTFDGNITGEGKLIQNGKGTLALTGANAHSGGTTVTQGVLQIGDGGTKGSISGDVVTGSKGTLAFDRADAVTFGGNITGEGKLIQNGKGTLALTGTNIHSGGTVIRHGILQIGDGHNSGTLTGLVESGEGTKLVFNRADQMAFSGSLKGQGQMVQAGNGITLLTGINNYTGTTEVQKGALRQGAEGAFSADSSYTIGQHGKLDMGGFNTTISALNNSGTVLAGGDDKAVGRTLVITGNYGGNNGIVNLSTVLEGDNSKTDRLVVNGSTSGTTHLVIKNVGGAGAPTTEGIKVVDVKGTSDGTFSLVGDYSYKGDPAVVVGAYAYRLHKHGIDNSDGNWYLRSSLTSPKPNPDPLPKPQQLYHAGVSVYEAYGRVLQTLNMPESLHGQVGGREDKLRGVNSFRTTADEGSADDSTNPSLPNGTWGRMIASYGKLSPRITTSGAGDITYNMARAQIGIDGRFYENDHGSVVGGGFLQYSNINANVGSVHGEGKIRANGYTIGATGTWYGNNGFYLDGLTQLTYFENDLDSKTASRQLGNNKSALGYALGLEAGQRFDLTPKWSLTPQVQLVHSAINMNDFHDTFGAKVRFDQSRNMKLRVGVTLDYSQKWYDDQGKSEQAAKIYGLFNIRQELLGSNDAVDVENVAFHGGSDRTWAETGIGGSYNWNDGNSFIYGQTSVNTNTSLNNFADSYELSAKIGLRVTW